MTPSEVRSKVVSALTAYDRKQQGKRGYTFYALAHYCDAAQNLEAVLMAEEKGEIEPRSLRYWILAHFSGAVANAALKAVGESCETKDESFGGRWSRPDLEELRGAGKDSIAGYTRY